MKHILTAFASFATADLVALSDKTVGDEFDIQWMPPGKQDITCFVNGQPRRLRFTASAALAEQLDAQLQQSIALAQAGDGDLPFFDFDHKDESASGNPAKLYWAGDDRRTGGIRAKGRWTGSGKSALQNRDYRRFSPRWDFDEQTEEPLGISINLGGLVNRAAFKNIAPVVAKDASAATQETNMTDQDKADFRQMFADGLKPIGDRVAALEANAKSATSTEAITTAVAAGIKPLDDRLKAMETSGVKAQAKAAVQVHIARGAIAPQDTKSIEFWESAHIANAALAEEQMGKLAGTRRGPVVPTGGATAAAKGGEPETRIFAAAKEARKTNTALASDADALSAYLRTPEGQEAYKAYREDVKSGAERFGHITLN